MPRTIRTLLGDINRKYVYNSNSVTTAYERRYGLYCDLYFPVHNISPQNKSSNGQPYYRNGDSQESGEYNEVNIFEPHEQPAYRDIPDVQKLNSISLICLKKRI
jgi:hypothetical protein